MDIPANIQECLRTVCSGGGCHVDLSGIAADVDVLSMDCLKRVIRPQGRICDCGVLWKSTGRIAAIELKGGQNISIKNLVLQLQGGLNLLDKILDGQDVEDFFPILLYSGRRRIHSALAKKQVCFRGQPRHVIVKSCGASLASIVANRKPTSIRQGGRRRRGR